MRTKKNEFSLEEAISLLMQNICLRPKVSQKDIKACWEEIVGTAIAKQTQSIYISQQCLHIKISNPLWRKELQYQSKELLQHINQFAGYELIKEIKIS